MSEREEYDGPGLREDAAAADPIAQFDEWYREALAADIPQPDAMVLSTMGEDGPSSRAVLLKGLDENGFVFFTNYSSRKGRELAANPRAALCFVWLPLHRQVRIEGVAAKIDPAESDAYFATRPRGAQIAAAVSPQSEVVPSREQLESEFARLAAELDGEPLRPGHWGGYRLRPHVIEFWQGRRDRLHDRLRYRRSEDGWIRERLAP